jgi:S-DNA-T family DNA segregation ATPase FtsK/SpoIIIE
MTIYQLKPADGSSVVPDAPGADDWEGSPAGEASSAFVREPAGPRPWSVDGSSGADETPTLILDGADGNINTGSFVPAGTDPSATPSDATPTASRTGSVLKATAATAWTGATYLGHGALHSVTAGVRHIRAHDHREAAGGIKSKEALNLLEAVRKDRIKFLRNAAIIGLVGSVIGYAEAGWIVPAVEASAAVIGVGTLGRRMVGKSTSKAGPQAAGSLIPQSTSIPSDTPPMNLPRVFPDPIDDGEPFPLSYCTTPEQATICLSRALAAQNLKARELRVVQQYAWGWEFDILLKGATPADISAALDKLEGHMDLPHAGFLPESDPGNRSHLTVRLVTSDPFALMPAPVVHAPRSLSIHDLIVLGQAMDGSPLELTLDGFFGAVIGAMGAGKSLGALRALAEAITACVDAVAWDLDPVKGGLSEFGDTMALRARGQDECMAALELVMAYVEGRRLVFHEVGMKDRWIATPEHPALFVFIDEYIHLTKEAKKLAIQIMRIARQYGIYLIIAGQEITEDALGDAIGALLAYQIMMSCRPEDTRIAFGAGRIAEGWLPHRLKPSVGKILNDAGKSFIMGGTFTRPIQYRFWGYGPDQIAAAVPERLAAGMTRIDADTRRAAGEKVTSDGREMTLADRVDALATEHGATDGPVISALLRLYYAKGATFVPSSILIEYLAGEGITWAQVEVDGDRLGRILRAHAPGATVSRPVIDGKQVRGWYLEDVKRAAEGLLDPSRARHEAA